MEQGTGAGAAKLRDVATRTIRTAEPADIAACLDIYDQARAFMRRSGNLTQWPEGYPGTEDMRRDIDNGCLYVCCEGPEVLAVFFFSPGPDRTYATIDGAWISDKPYYVVHRIAAREGTGAGRHCLAWALDHAQSLRIDTHEDNAPMRHVLTSLGFVECGIIICENGTPRVAYQYDRP